MAEKKIMTDEEYLAFQKSLLADLPEKAKDRLKNGIYSDVELCKMLAQEGVDLEAIERKINNAGFDTRKIGLQVPDDELYTIHGGFHEDDFGGEIVCECGNSDRNQFSRQFWSSMFSIRKSYYRCKKCNTYIAVAGKGSLMYLTKEEYEKERDEYWGL